MSAAGIRTDTVGAAVHGNPEPRVVLADRRRFLSPFAITSSPFGAGRTVLGLAQARSAEGVANSSYVGFAIAVVLEEAEAFAIEGVDLVVTNRT